MKPLDIECVADRHPRMRGLAQLRKLLPLIDGGAESPPETRTRLLLVRSGLPSPQTQIVITDDFGRVIARADMGWREWKVIVEYEGEHHWTDPVQRA